MKKVTVWHKGERYCFPLMSLRITLETDKNGIKQRGFFDNSMCTLRIPAKSEFNFCIGDFVRIGEHTGGADRDTDFKVMKIINNLRGTTPHYRLVCEK